MLLQPIDSVTVIVKENEINDQISNLDEAVTFHLALMLFGKEWIYLRCLDVDE